MNVTTGWARATKAIAIATCLGGIASAAWAASDARLTARLDPRTAAVVTGVIDSAGSRGLPTEPLVARALEGASRRASGPRIVAAVRHLATSLETARQLLGERSSPADLVAGATALAAHVPPDTLVRLRLARGEGSVVVPLVVLADLITRRVPIATASAAVLAATRAHARDEDLMRLRERIDEDIRTGTAPGSATIVRTRNLIGTFDAPDAGSPAGRARP